MRSIRLDLILAAWVCCLWPAPSSAQSRPSAEITIEGSRGYSLLLAGVAGPHGAEASSLLEGCLARDGQFSFTTGSNGVAYSIRLQAGQEQLEGSVTAPSGQSLLSRTYRGEPLRQQVFRFSDDLVAAITGSPGVACSRIAFVSDRSGQKEIYLCDASGGQIQQITKDRSLCVSPSISHDGRYLAFTSYVSGYADVYVQDLTQRKRLRAFAQPGTNTGAAISPSGNEIALTMSHPGNPEIFVGPLTGGSARRLTANRFVEASPAWSPDGKHLVFVSDANGRPQLFIAGSGGGRPMALDTGFPDCFEPDWSPDGQRIAFTIRSGGTHQIALYDLQKKSSQLLTRGPGSEQPLWGANSRHLIYLEGNAIVIHEIESGSREPVISGFGRISEIAWTR